MGSLMPDGAYSPIRGADTLSAARLDSIRARQAAMQARRGLLTRKLMTDIYAQPALMPAATWLDDDPPPAPRVTLRRQGKPALW